MRDIVRANRFSPDLVRLTCLLAERQQQFVSSVTKGAAEGADRRVLVLWRRGQGQVKLEWLEGRWEAAEAGNATAEELRETLARLLSANEVLSGEAVLEQLVDEHATTLFARIANKIIELSEVQRDNLTKDELIPAARLVLTVTVIIAGGYVVSYLVKSREENVQKQLGLQGPTRVYMGLHGPTRAYRGLRGSTWAYRGLWGPTGAYRSVGESRNHQTQMSLIKDHFTHSHF